MQSHATYAGYNYVLAQFQNTCSKVFLNDINKADLENFVVAMKREELSDRTIANRVSEVVTFLRAHDITNVKLAHKYMEKPAKAYRPDELNRFFAHANQDESDLFLFLLSTVSEMPKRSTPAGRTLTSLISCSLCIQSTTGLASVIEGCRSRYMPSSRE